MLAEIAIHMSGDMATMPNNFNDVVNYLKTKNADHPVHTSGRICCYRKLSERDEWEVITPNTCAIVSRWFLFIYMCSFYLSLKRDEHPINFIRIDIPLEHGFPVLRRMTYSIHHATYSCGTYKS